MTSNIRSTYARMLLINIRSACNLHAGCNTPWCGTGIRGYFPADTQHIHPRLHFLDSPIEVQPTLLTESFSKYTGKSRFG